MNSKYLSTILLFIIKSFNGTDISFSKGNHASIVMSTILV